MHYPLNQILNSSDRPKLIILRWKSDPSPTHLPCLKVIMKSSPEIRKEALEYMEHLIHAIKFGNVYYSDFLTHRESLRRIVIAKKRLVSTFLVGKN